MMTCHGAEQLQRSEHAMAGEDEDSAPEQPSAACEVAAAPCSPEHSSGDPGSCEAGSPASDSKGKQASPVQEARRTRQQGDSQKRKEEGAKKHGMSPEQDDAERKKVSNGAGCAAEAVSSSPS